jgi:hypothetical protein
MISLRTVSVDASPGSSASRRRQIKGNSASCQGNGYSDRWFPIAHQLLLRAQGVLQAALQTVNRWDRRSVTALERARFKSAASIRRQSSHRILDDRS